LTVNLYNAKRKKFPPLPKPGQEIQNMMDNIWVQNKSKNAIATA